MNAESIITIRLIILLQLKIKLSLQRSTYECYLVRFMGIFWLSQSKLRESSYFLASMQILVYQDAAIAC